MLFVAWIQWWYGLGWQQTARVSVRRAGRIYQTFSVPLLATTLFAPWRRIITPGGGSMSQRAKAMADNAVSRAVGFGVRLGALICALMFMAIITVGGVILAIIWPFIPILGVTGLVLGIVK